MSTAEISSQLQINFEIHKVINTAIVIIKSDIIKKSRTVTRWLIEITSY